MNKIILLIFNICFVGGILGAQDWRSSLQEGLSHHPEIQIAKTALEKAQDNLQVYNQSRWSFPLGVTTLTSGTATDTAIFSGSVNAGLGFPIGETEVQKSKRQELEETVVLSELTLVEKTQTTMTLGIQIYWEMVTALRKMEVSEIEQGIQTKTLERVKKLWDLGQASLTDWTTVDQSLRNSEATFILTRQKYLESRRSWYTFIGKPDGGEVWNELPQLKDSLPLPWSGNPESKSAWVQIQAQKIRAQRNLVAEKSWDLPLNIKASITGFGGNNVSVSLSGANSQGSVNWQSPVLSSGSLGAGSWSWSLQASLNPDLLVYFQPKKSSAIELKSVQAQAEITQSNLISQTETLKDHWISALAALESSKSSLNRMKVINDSVQIKVSAGRAIPLEGETSSVELEKANLAVETARLTLFTAATAAGEDSEKMILWETQK